MFELKHRNSSKRTHDVEWTSYRRRYGVILLHRRQCDVSATSVRRHMSAGQISTSVIIPKFDDSSTVVADLSKQCRPWSDCSYKLDIHGLLLHIHSREIETLHFFNGKIHGVWFKVIDGDNEPSSFQEMPMNSIKQCLKWLPMKKKRIPVMITSIAAFVNVSYFLRIRRFYTQE